MFVLHTELQAVTALLPAQGIAHGVGFLDSAIVGKRIGAQVEVVGHGDFWHTREQIAERRRDSQLCRTERLLRTGPGSDDAVSKAQFIYHAGSENVRIVERENALIQIRSAAKTRNRQGIRESEQIE